MPAPPDLRDHLQSTVGDAYLIERELGGGGMSRVFVAEETRLGRRVVVKVLAPELANGLNAARFEREIRLAAQLQHPHIVPVLTAGDAGGLPYYTMPFVDGESLRARLSRAGALPPADAVTILRDIALALEYAHAHNIVHRDIKPDNVFISGRTALVLDFGIAKAIAAARTLPGDSTLTAFGMAIGTPAYMAPEQAAGDPDLDHRADIYAWGCVAYEALTGRSPFSNRSPQATLAAQIAEKPDQITTLRPTVSAALAALVMQCLEKRPADRPQTMANLVHALDAAAATEQQTLPPAARSTARFATRNVTVTVAVGALVVAGTLFVKHRFAPARRIERIAVLPVENTTGDTTSLLSGAITGALIQSLTNAGLHVPGYRSVVRFRPTDPVVPIAKKLNVSAVVSGELFRQGSQIGIRLHVDDGVTGDALWNKEIRIDTAQISTLADRAADPLISWVRPAASGVTLRHASARSTNPDAYRAYLLAANTAERLTMDALRSSVAQYRLVIAKDSNFAPAFAGMALALEIGFQYGLGGGEAAHRDAQAAIARALALDPDLAYAHAARGMLLQNRDWDWAHADDSYRHAVALEPSPRTLALYSWFLGWWIGKTDSAVAVARHAVQLDDQVALLHSNLASRLQEAGQLNEGRSEATYALALDSSASDPHRVLERIAVAEHSYADADRELRRFEQLTHLVVPGFEAQLDVHLGRTDHARQIESQLKALGADAGSVQGIGYQLALTQLALNERDAALSSLERATQAHDFWAPFASDWDPLRTEPRFQALVARMGLPAAGARP